MRLAKGFAKRHRQVDSGRARNRIATGADQHDPAGFCSERQVQHQVYRDCLDARTIWRDPPGVEEVQPLVHRQQ